MTNRCAARSPLPHTVPQLTIHFWTFFTAGEPGPSSAASPGNVDKKSSCVASLSRE